MRTGTGNYVYEIVDGWGELPGGATVLGVKQSAGLPTGSTGSGNDWSVPPMDLWTTLLALMRC
jgi:hypothetical protein